MAKLVVAKDGVVVNLVAIPAAEADGEVTWVVDDANPVQVGDAFDIRDKQVDEYDLVAARILFRHENLIRQLIRALRATSTGANNAATNAGLPTTANAADVTAAQFRTAVKSLL